MAKKQHLEGILSKNLKQIQTDHHEHKIWYMKIQNNPLAHKQTPADYIVLTKNNNCLIECKETKTEIFNSSRITQDTELEMFAKLLERNMSYILICFWKGTAKKSKFYLIEYLTFKNRLEMSNKKSMTLYEFEKYFHNNELTIEKEQMLKGLIESITS